MTSRVHVGDPDPEDALQLLAQGAGSAVLSAAREAGIDLDYSLIILSGQRSAGVAVHAEAFPEDPPAAVLFVLERLLFHTRRIAETAGLEPVAFTVRNEHGLEVNLYPEPHEPPGAWRPEL